MRWVAIDLISMNTGGGCGSPEKWVFMLRIELSVAETKQGIFDFGYLERPVPPKSWHSNCKKLVEVQIEMVF